MGHAALGRRPAVRLLDGWRGALPERGAGTATDVTAGHSGCCRENLGTRVT